MAPSPTTAKPTLGAFFMESFQRSASPLALAVCASEPLVANRLVIKPAQFLDSTQHLVDCVRDRIHICSASKEELVRKLHSFMVCGAVRFGAGIHVSKIERLFAAPTQRREVGRIYREQRAFVHRFVEKAIAGNTF